VQLVAIVLGSVGGVWTSDATSFTLFTLADALALPAAVTAVMRYRPGRKRPVAAAAKRQARDERPFAERDRAELLARPSAVTPIWAVSF
jgi:hypothetical protein